MLSTLLQDNAASPDKSMWLNLLASWGPLFLIATLIYVFVFRGVRGMNDKAMADHQEDRQRLRDHHAAVEAKLERLAQAVEKLANDRER